MTGVQLLALGGTISMRPGPSGAVPVACAAGIAERVEGFKGAEDIVLVGGSEVDFEIMERLVGRCVELDAESAAGVVVTTGTDSIEEVSSWLAYRERWSMPVVVTGSMVAGDRFDSDGTANLSDALAVASSGCDVDPLVVFGGRVWAAREVMKMSGVERDAFAAPGRGALGVVSGGTVSWYRHLNRRATHGAPARRVVPVPIVLACMADDGSILDGAGARHPAIVVAANGAGNLPPGQAAAARRLIDAGKLVVITTRAPDARVAPLYGYPGGSAQLAAAGAVLVSGVSPHRARLLLTLGIAQGRDIGQLRELLADEADAA